MSTTFARPEFLTSAEQLSAQLSEGSVRVFDCTVHLHPSADNAGHTAESGRADWEAGHIPGAGFIDLIEDLSVADSPYRFVVPDADTFAAAMSRLGVGDGTRIVLYDSVRNQWAARVWWMLRGFGFDDVSVLDGGLATWKAKGLPISMEPASYPAATFKANPRPGYFVDKADVVASIEADDTVLLNALTAEQHAGAGGVHYGRAGRIPGSTNVAARDLIDPDTYAYLPVEDLRKMFADAGTLEGQRVVCYCGGGIAASSTALVLTLLGVENVGVYTNSLQEWTQDESCPLVRD
jgi:thiosulfate/3-mercaptopyruvate sulfurtransferase